MTTAAMHQVILEYMIKHILDLKKKINFYLIKK